MTAKEYLRQIQILDKKINQRIEERETLFARAASAGGKNIKPDLVQSSVDGDKTGRMIDRYVDLEKKIDGLIDRFVTARNKIIGQIQQVDNPKHMELLYLRYVKYMRLEEVSCTMTKTTGEPYSYEHINRMHGQALQEFAIKFADDMKMTWK